MSRSTKPLVGVFALGLSLFLGCAPASAEDLMDIYRLALERDPVYLAARAKANANHEAYRQARAALLPNLSASANKTRNKDTVKAPGVAFTVEGDAEFDSEFLSLDLVQPLFDYASFHNYAKARHTARAAEFDLRAAAQDLIVRTARAYLLVLGYGDTLNLAQAERIANQRQLDLANARLEVGMGTVTDQHEALARFKTSEAQEIEATDALEDAREGLRELTGERPGQLAALGEARLEKVLDPPNLDAWVEIALQENIELQSVRETAEAAAREISVQKGGFLPTLDLIARRSRFESDGSLAGGGTIQDATDIMLQLEVPLFQGGRVVSRTAQARELHRAALQNLEGKRRNVERQARAAFLGVASHSKRVEALSQAVTASESALEGKVKGFEAGLNSNLDVLNSQRDLFLAKRDYLRARYDYLLNLLDLKLAAGRLAETDLAQLNTWLK
ncbi:MAG: TolC family outer membrane protein [Gammaproteobacteria bacterium]|nr:TolC family outer membrane protein [Gammaproteobacteria bacterium]